MLLFTLFVFNFLSIHTSHTNLFDAIGFSFSIKLWKQQSHGREERISLSTDSLNHQHQETNHICMLKYILN